MAFSAGEDMKLISRSLIYFCIGVFAFFVGGSSSSYADVSEAFDAAIKQNTKTPAELETLCEAEDAISCVVLGEIYYRGKKVEKNTIRSEELMKRACSIGNQDACFLLAGIYLYPKEGYSRDVGAARSLLSNGCRQSHAASCYMYGLQNLGFFLPNHQKPEDGDAESYLKKACKLGEEGGCMVLSELYGMGQFFEKNLKQSRKYYDKACGMFKQKDANAYKLFCYRLCFPKEQRPKFLFFGAWSTNNFCDIM